MLILMFFRFLILVEAQMLKPFMISGKILW